MTVDVVLAFDLGGTRLKAGRVDLASAEVLEFTVVESSADADAALSCIDEVGAKLLGAGACDAVGLAVPGLVEDSGRIVALPGKLAGIVGRDLRAHLDECFKIPAVVINDAVAFGSGEACHGAAHGHERAVVVTIGTGVGVSVIQDGLPITSGALGGGILGGQIPIADDPAGPIDTNGKHGTIEALCRAERIVERARIGGAWFDSPADVYAAAAAHDRIAREAIEGFRHDLVRALVALAHAHTPSVIVVGGGPMHADSPLFDGLEHLVNDQLWPGYEVAVAPAALGDHAALFGLAAIASRSAVA